MTKPVNALDLILAIGVGFVIHPIVDDFADGDFIRAGIGLLYVGFFLRRLWPKLPTTPI